MARNDGFLKISRRFFDHPLWTQKRRFSRAEAWIDLLRRAAWKPHAVFVQSTKVWLEAGEMVASFRVLAADWGWGVASCSRFIRALKAEQMVEQRTERGVSVLRIVNYATYNGGADDAEQEPERAAEQKRNASGTPAEQPEEEKEKKEETPTPRACAREAEGGGGELFDLLKQRYPELERVTANAFQALIGGQNGKTADVVALLVLACRDQEVRSPAAVIESRIGREKAPRSLVDDIRGVMHPPRDKQTCHCGGGLATHNSPGAGWYGKRCAACGQTYEKSVIRGIAG